MKHVGERWENTPCSRCELKEDSSHTREYQEKRIENATWDINADNEMNCYSQITDPLCPQPFDNLELEEDDPKIPLSRMVSAMELWLRLSLPARKTIQMRLQNLPYSEIADRLGCSRQAAEKMLASVLSREPLIRNLLPRKAPRDSAPLSATPHSAVADVIRRSACRKKKSKK
jgi:hypothetical protein